MPHILSFSVAVTATYSKDIPCTEWLCLRQHQRNNVSHCAACSYTGRDDFLSHESSCRQMAARYALAHNFPCTRYSWHVPLCLAPWLFDQQLEVHLMNSSPKTVVMVRFNPYEHKYINLKSLYKNTHYCSIEYSYISCICDMFGRTSNCGTSATWL